MAESNPPQAATTIDVQSETLIIGLGESVRVDVPSSVKVHVSDGGIARSRVIGRSIMMTGKRTGRTSLRFVRADSLTSSSNLDQDKTIVVTERKIATAARLFQKRIESGRGLKLNAQSFPQIIVSGELLRIDDWDRLVAIAREAKVPWRLEARIFPELTSAFRKKLEIELTRLAWPGQLLTVGDHGPTLTGGAESAAMSAEQKLTVTTLGIQIETSAGLTELEPMVRTQIVIAEVRRNRSRTFGVKWPDSVSASIAPTLQIPSSQLLVDLQAMEEEGEGRILAMPTLLCRSGGEAKFMAGGEIPIKLISERVASVEWKKYGIMLHVQPKADRMKRMKFQLSTEVSSIDGSVKTKDGVTGISINRIETQFNLEGPQTIVLSGLIKSDQSTSTQGIPLLKSIPILGSLFQSESFAKSLTELIIFVSPEVIIPGEGVKNDNGQSPR